MNKVLTSNAVKERGKHTGTPLGCHKPKKWIIISVPHFLFWRLMHRGGGGDGRRSRRGESASGVRTSAFSLRPSKMRKVNSSSSWTSWQNKTSQRKAVLIIIKQKRKNLNFYKQSLEAFRRTNFFLFPQRQCLLSPYVCSFRSLQQDRRKSGYLVMQNNALVWTMMSWRWVARLPLPFPVFDSDCKLRIVKQKLLSTLYSANASA